MYRVRFNLGKGENFRKWKVEERTINGKYKTVGYYDPEIFSFLLSGCKLHNGRATAEKIHQGANKTVCAWIECEIFVNMRPRRYYSAMPEISYNPKEAPYWRDPNGNNIDGLQIDDLITIGNRVYIR